MIRILAIMDTNHFSTNVLDFASYIARLTKSSVTGLLMAGHTHRHSLAGTVKGHGPEASGPQPGEGKHADLFIEGCICRDTTGHVETQCHTLDDISKKTRFADLIIVDPAFSLEPHAGAVPSKFVRDLLLQAECPVIMAPDTDMQIDEVVFAYDGSPSSMFAIKHFTYLLQQHEQARITLLEIRAYKNTMREQYEVNEWLGRHYTNVSYEVLHGRAEEELFKYFLGRQNTLLVMGAFGRNLLSSFFKHSTADLLLRAVDIPMFIAHQ